MVAATLQLEPAALDAIVAAVIAHDLWEEVLPIAEHDATVQAALATRVPALTARQRKAIAKRARETGGLQRLGVFGEALARLRRVLSRREHRRLAGLTAADVSDRPARCEEVGLLLAGRRRRADVAVGIVLARRGAGDRRHVAQRRRADEPGTVIPHLDRRPGEREGLDRRMPKEGRRGEGGGRRGGRRGGGGGERGRRRGREGEGGGGRRRRHASTDLSPRDLAACGPGAYSEARGAGTRSAGTACTRARVVTAPGTVWCTSGHGQPGRAR